MCPSLVKEFPIQNVSGSSGSDDYGTQEPLIDHHGNRYGRFLSRKRPIERTHAALECRRRASSTAGDLKNDSQEFGWHLGEVKVRISWRFASRVCNDGVGIASRRFFKHSGRLNSAEEVPL